MIHVGNRYHSPAWTTIDTDWHLLLELLLLVGKYYFSSVIHFTLMKLISIVCIIHTCHTDVISESFKEKFTLFFSSWLVLILWFFYKDILKMAFKCSVDRCITNYDCYDRGALFSLPEKEEQKKQLDLVFKSKGYFIHKESQDLLQTLSRQSS